MELSSIFTLSTTTHYTNFSPTFSFFLLAGDYHPRFVQSSHNSSSEPPSTSSSSSSTPHFPTNLRRPKTTLKTTAPTPKNLSNPLKNLRISQSSSQQDNLTPKLRLTTKLSPPNPPSPRNENLLVNVIHEEEEEEEEEETDEQEEDNSGKVEFRQEGKIFVGNLPLWIKKPQIFEFFRQFGDIKSVILIKGHENLDRNLGFGFVIFEGPNAEKSASKAVEFDGMEFHGRILTVKLDDGRRRKTVVEERQRWVEKGGEGREYRSKWHEERDGCRVEFQKVLDSQPENWQAVVRAFERVKKV